MLRHLEEIADASKAAGTREIRSDLVERHRFDRIHFDLPILHPVPVAGPDVGPLPYANAARDLPGSDTVAEILDELHATSVAT